MQDSKDYKDLEVHHEASSLKADITEPVTGIKFVFLLMSLTCASLLVFLDTSVISTAVPKITDEFQSLADVGWYGSAYQLGSAVVGPLSGRIYHYFSLKWSYVAFFTIFELGSALCGAAQSSKMLIIGRAIAGVGAAGINSGAYIILSAAVPMKKRPAMLGLLLGIAQLGTICGPLVGGAFTTGYTWRWCFYINLPLGALVGVPLFLMRIPDQVSKPRALSILPKLHRHLDLLGFSILAPAIIMLLLALQYGGHEYAWSSSQVIGLFCGFGATFAVWAVWNCYRGDSALLPMSIIRRRAIWMSGLNFALMTATVFGSSYYLPIYYQAVKGVSAIMSGVYLLAMILPQLISAVVSGSLVTRIGFVPPFAIVGATLAAIGSGLFSLFQPDTSTGEWIGYSIITGVGRGMALQMPVMAIQAIVSQEEMSQAMAFAVFCQYIGPTIFLALYNTVFDNSLPSQLRTYAPDANSTLVIAAGATEFRKVVIAQQLPGVLKAFSTSVDHVFYLQAGAGVVAWAAAWGMSWKKIDRKKAVAADHTAGSDSTVEYAQDKAGREQGHSV